MSFFQHALFLRLRMLATGAPRRPRHPLLRLALGLLGITLLVALVVLGVFVGAAMLTGGMLRRLWTQRGARDSVRRRGRTLDGDYQVVGKAQLPLAH